MAAPLPDASASGNASQSNGKGGDPWDYTTYTRINEAKLEEVDEQDEKKGEEEKRCKSEKSGGPPKRATNTLAKNVVSCTTTWI
jgi:hypothetical protein